MFEPARVRLREAVRAPSGRLSATTQPIARRGNPITVGISAKLRPAMRYLYTFVGVQNANQRPAGGIAMMANDPATPKNPARPDNEPDPVNDSPSKADARRGAPVGPQQETPRVVPKWIGVVGLFVAPTTVITSLCYFFGYVATRTYFAYFGIDTDAIGFTTGDYAMRSIPALYMPLIAGLLTWVAMLWAGEYLRRLVQSGRRPRLVRRIAWAAVALGAVSIARAILGLKPEWALIHGDPVTPVTLGLGSALLVVGFSMLVGARAATDAPRELSGAHRASFVVAAGGIVAALFWITAMVATARGLSEAEIARSHLWDEENTVVLVTDASQSLPVPPKQIRVSWVPPVDPAAKPTLLRYQCFRSLTVHNNRWVLVPARWTPEYGYAVIITTDSSHLISLLKIQGVAESDAANRRDGDWQCPEIGPGAPGK
jgi:hypothetical protein